MVRRRAVLRALSFALLAGSIAVASGEPYPNRTVTIVVPFAAGSSPDAAVRAIAKAASKELAQAVIVDNKPGAGAIIAAQNVARASPDGYTLLVSGNVAFTANPSMVRRLPYDPVRDFEPITALARGAMILFANAKSVPSGGVAEVVRLAKQQPGKLTYGYTSATSRMPAEVLQQAAGIQLNGVPYKAGFQALPDLLAGRIDLLFTDLGGMPYVKAGQLRALAIADAKRSPLTPDVPTLQEAGIQGEDLTYWVAAYAPARTPPAVVERLHDVLAKACQASEVRTAMAAGGTAVFVTTPAELRRFQAEEARKWARVIRAAGIEPE